MKKEPSQIASLTSSRAFKTFIPFLFLSYIIWSLNDFAERKVDTIPVVISYKNSPQNKLLSSIPKKYLQVEVESSGFNILRSKLLKKELLINLKQATFNSDTSSYIQTKQFLTSVQNKLPNTMKVLRISPDTLTFKYKILIKKEVPILLKSVLNFQKGFSNTDSIYLKTNKIIIFGNKKQLDKIKFIETELITLDNVKNNIFKKVALVQKDNIKYAKDSVQLIATVDQMIAGEISLFFQLKNVKKQQISTFPKKITVAYKAPLEVYKNIKPSDFSIICDFKERKNGSLIPKIIKKPNQLKITAIKPKTIQYIIKN
jgi:hypothetical protein